MIETAPAIIHTARGSFMCRADHGRLRWRAETFHTEEPETVRWLDTIKEDDVYWDIGANVGLYAIYVAMFRKCKVVAFEPESQNYALLVENVILNGAQLEVAPIAICGDQTIGRLKIPELTKGGAYNSFGLDGWQRIFGVSIDRLVSDYGFAAPTHLKIDVDGIEADIIAGAAHTLCSIKSVMIEINGETTIRDILVGNGLSIVSDVPCARSKTGRNVIFERKAEAA